MTACCDRIDEHTHDVVIRSTTDPRTHAPACLVTWGQAVQMLITPETTVTTARDLMAAAIRAETDIAVLKVFRDTLGLDATTTGHLILQLRTARHHSSGQPALRIDAVAGLRTEKPYVHIARGSMKASLDPDEARVMAQHRFQTATAAEIDHRLRRALDAWDRDLTTADIEQLFSLVAGQQ